jgi:hypothetical protein
MNAVSVELEHPILFVFDYTNRSMQIPEYDNEITVSANSSALSVKAVSEVDGPVQVHLSAEIPRNVLERLSVVFRGTIDVPNNRVSVVTSDNKKLLELDIGRAEADVTVAVDNEMHPSDIWIGAAASSR